MPTTKMLLPFHYKSKLYPSPRHRVARDYVLRADAIVDVPMLSLSEMNVVIQLPYAGKSWGREEECGGQPIIVERDGRLLSAVHMRGQPTSSPYVMDLIAEPFIVRPYWHRPWKGRRGFDHLQFPVANTRHRVAITNVLSFKSFGEQAIADGWDVPRVLLSDLADSEAEAVGYYSKAFAIVDGDVFAECQEPVWQVRHMEGKEYELVIERRPWATAAHSFFRLDQRERALEWADERKMRITWQPAGRTALAAGALTRFDALEVATSALQSWPELRHWCEGKSIQLYGRGGQAETLDRLLEQSPVPNLYEIPEIMQALSQIVREDAPHMTWRGRRYGRPGAIMEGIKRWDFEARRIDRSVFSALSEDDLAALETIAT